MLDALRSARAALDAMLADEALLAVAASVPARLARTIREGGKIMACGNGGSACDAMHFCEELTGRFRADRPPIAALACVDPGHLTCTANDYGYEEVFARWVRGLGRRGDALVLLSTSGNSPNVLRAIDAAREVGLWTIGLLARGGVGGVGGVGGAGGGGKARGRCDVELLFPGGSSDRIQELHMLVLHAWVEALERELGYAPSAG